MSSKKKKIADQSSITDEDKAKFADLLVYYEGNRTKAYKALRPEVKDSTAKNEGSKLAREPYVQGMYKKALELSGVNLVQVLQELNTDAGKGRKATHRDWLTSRKMILDVIKLASEETTQEVQENYKNLGNDDLMAKLEALQSDINTLKPSSSFVEGEVIEE